MMSECCCAGSWRTFAGWRPCSDRTGAVSDSRRYAPVSRGEVLSIWVPMDPFHRGTFHQYPSSPKR
jgi:hypothetical protein